MLAGCKRGALVVHWWCGADLPAPRAHVSVTPLRQVLGLASGASSRMAFGKG